MHVVVTDNHLLSLSIACLSKDCLGRVHHVLHRFLGWAHALHRPPRSAHTIIAPLIYYLYWACLKTLHHKCMGTKYHVCVELHMHSCVCASSLEAYSAHSASLVPGSRSCGPMFSQFIEMGPHDDCPHTTHLSGPMLCTGHHDRPTR